MSDLWELIIGIILIAIALTVLTLGISYGLMRPTCYATWDKSGLEIRWSLLGGCQLSEDGRIWFPEAAYTQIHREVSVE